MYNYNKIRYSHAYYRQYMNQMPSTPWGVPLHCDLRRLKTPTGIIRILLVVSCNISRFDLTRFQIDSELLTFIYVSYVCFQAFDFVTKRIEMIQYANKYFTLIYICRFHQPHVWLVNFQQALCKLAYFCYRLSDDYV